jgi:putative endonuclease
MKKGGSVYILTDKSNTVLYIGVTSNLLQRLYQHRTGKYPNSFTSRYHCTKLVYHESFPLIVEAIAREKQLKNWHRDWKINLINRFNPEWRELAETSSA